jgi:hypothetical protein
MEVTRDEARDTLRDVESVAQLVRGKLATGMTGPILIVWGAIWATCFALTHFAPAAGSWAWLAGDALGIAGTIWLSRRAGVEAVRSAAAQRLWWKVFWFWFLLVLYANIWLAIFWPWRVEQVGLFLVTLIMFAYVVMGLWLGSRFLLALGLAVTALAGVGYVLSFLVPGYLDLWLGSTGGLALLVSGLYLTLRRR